MSECRFETTDDENHIGWKRLICKRCGSSMFSPDPPERTRRICSHGGNCAHLGPEVRQQECPTCSGRIRVKVFACEVYGECSLVKTLAGVQCCQGCPSYLAIQRAEAG